jgi:hypothetical protein
MAPTVSGECVVVGAGGRRGLMMMMVLPDAGGGLGKDMEREAR